MDEQDGLAKHIQLDGRDDLGGSDGLPPTKPVGVVKQFYRDLIAVLTEPKLFFEVRYPETSFSYALAFGVVVAWVAAILSWLTRIIRHETLLDGLVKLQQRLQELPLWKDLPANFWAQGTPEPSQYFPAWVAELLGVSLAPFTVLMALFFYGIIIFMGAYLLVPKSEAPVPGRDPLELKNAIRIVSFASAPVLVAAILGFLPIGLGMIIGRIYGLVLLVLGLSKRFQVSGLRAFGIVILPGILAFVFMGCIVGVLGALFFGIFASFFGGMH